MTESNKPAVIEPRELAHSASPPEVIELLRLAVDKEVPVEALEKLMDLHERAADRAAAQEFNAALAAFQAAVPSIETTQVVDFVSSGGGRTKYRFADLDTIAKTIKPLLEKHGLAYTWDSSYEGQVLTCVCTLRHVNGHQQSASFASPTQSKAGMSEQQKFAAALTYARRQSLVQVLGLTTCDPDNDGAASGELITEQQAADLEALIEEVGANRERFLKFLGVADVAELPAPSYRTALNALEAKRRKT